MTIKEREDALFDEWRKARPDYKSFITDGVIDENSFLESSPKIVFLLKEIDDYDKDLRELWGTTSRGHTVAGISHWTWGIREIYNNPSREITKADLPRNDADFRHKQICTVCAMNVKKVSGGASSNMSEVKKFAKRDADFLLRQLDIYKAEIVVCCGIEYPKHLDADFTYNGSEVWFGKDHERGSLVIGFRHPNRCPHDKTIMFFDAVREFKNRKV
jgi:hypothetical protein